MRNVKFKYNPETCHYERAKTGWRDIVVYGLGILVTSALFLSAVLVVHLKTFETNHQKELHVENKKLKAHKIILEKELSEIENTLAVLQEEERSLYTKLFNLAPLHQTTSASSISKKQVLLADASGFNSLLEMLSVKTTSLIAKSETTSNVFANAIEIQKNDLVFIASIPSLVPASDFTIEKMVSGFGTRVNPFHKGLYNHTGIDIVIPRGTEIIATAAGKVVDIRKSNLQAGYGNYIEIDHGHGFVTRYAHLEDIFVKPGQKITKSMAIGTSGNSGGSIAPHLHYEIIRNGIPVDPVYYMLEGLTSMEHSQLIGRSKKQNQSLD